jgi:hypothetical protein
MHVLASKICVPRGCLKDNQSWCIEFELDSRGKPREEEYQEFQPGIPEQ